MSLKRNHVIVLLGAILVLGWLLTRSGGEKSRVTIETLPTIAEFRDFLKSHLDSENHSELLLAAAGPISDVYELGKTNAEGEVFAFHFFKDCAESKEIINPVRAVCYRKYQALLEFTKNSDFTKLPVIDSGVEKLVNQL